MKLKISVGKRDIIVIEKEVKIQQNEKITIFILSTKTGKTFVCLQCLLSMGQCLLAS